MSRSTTKPRGASPSSTPPTTRSASARAWSISPELLLRSFELLLRNELLRAHYAGRFRHILVDEFQDTNRLQYRWLKLLAGATEGQGARPAPGGAGVRRR